MKTRWLICALLTAIIASVAAVLFKENAVLLAAGVFIVTCAGVLSLYFILKGPIENMRHQVMEVEEAFTMMPERARNSPQSMRALTFLQVHFG